MKRLFTWFLNLKIRNKLLLTYGIIIVVSVFMTGVINYYISNRVNSQVISDYSYSLLSQISINYEAKIKSIEEALFDKYKNSNLVTELHSLKPETEMQYSQLQRIQSAVSVMLNSTSYFKSIVLVGFGDKVFSAAKKGVQINDISEADIKSEASHLESLRGACLWSPGDGETVYLKRALLSTDTTRYLGFVIVGVDSKYLSSLYSGVNKRAAFYGDVFILNKDNQPLIYPENADTETLKHVLVTAGTEIAYEPRTTTYTASGSKYAAILLDTPDHRWKIVNTMLVKDITGDLRIIKYYIFLTCIFLTVLSFSIAFMISRNFSQSVGLLLSNIDRISTGDLSHRIVPVNHDEVGFLAERFDFMRERVIDLTEEIAVERERKKQSEYQMLEFRYNALQAQLNPHFMYNILDSISGLAQINNQEDICYLVCTLSDLLRESINRKTKFVSLEEEISYIRKYTSLYQYIYSDSVEFIYDIEPSVISCKVPNFILQPIVENAIVHGIEEKAGKGEIKVVCYAEEGALVLAVSDNGIGMEPPRCREILESVPQSVSGPEKHTHVGISSVQERIRLLYGEEYCGVSIRSQAGVGTDVFIRIPLNGV